MFVFSIILIELVFVFISSIYRVIQLLWDAYLLIVFQIRFSTFQSFVFRFPIFAFSRFILSALFRLVLFAIVIFVFLKVQLIFPSIHFISAPVIIFFLPQFLFSLVLLSTLFI